MTQAQKNGNNEERKILKERMLIKDNMGLLLAIKVTINKWVI